MPSNDDEVATHIRIVRGRVKIKKVGGEVISLRLTETLVAIVKYHSSGCWGIHV